MVVVDPEIVMEGVTGEVIAITIPFEVMGEPDGLQGDGVVVTTQVIISPFNKLLLVKVDELLPALTPFTFH